jgi:ataxin-3
MELQAALQASLMGGGLAEDFVLPPFNGRSFPSTSTSGPGSRTGGGTSMRTPTQQRSLPPMGSISPLGFPPSPPIRSQTQHDYDHADAVAASMARNKRIMEHMQREQEMALQEQYEEEAARIANGATGADSGAGGPAARTRARRGEEEEDEMLRRAIEESQLLAGEGSQASSTVITNPHAPLVIDDDDDEDNDADFVDAEMDVDSESEGYRLPVRPPAHPVPPLPNAGLGSMQPLSYPNHRVYDDDDAELQAALKASLENVPEGFMIPDIPPLPQPPVAASSSVPMQSAAATSSSSDRRGADDDDVASEADTSTEASQPEEHVSVDEMRRRRLARFGG